MSAQFSVIIPTYNRSEYVAAAVESALRQEYAPKEIIVYDDGSTDDTEKVLEKYMSQIAYHRSINKGLVEARKEAISHASGNWIALLDSDDIWKPEYLRNIKETIDTFPETGLIVSNFSNLDSNGHEFFDMFESAPEGWWNDAIEKKINNKVLLKTDCYIQYLDFNPGFASAMSFSRELYEKIGGMNPKVGRMLAEDSHFARRMAAHGRVSCNFDKSVYITRHSSNMSADIPRNFTDRLRILEMLIEDRDIPEKYFPATLNAIKNWRIDLFDTMFEFKKYHEARNIYKIIGNKDRSIKMIFKYYLSFLLR